MSSVVFDSVSITYPGADSPTVDQLDLRIDDGEFLVLVGPSGCGKSTTLRALAGLEQVTSGRILIGDEDVTQSDPKDRDIAMVFQTYALYPHYSVRKNLEFPLNLAGDSAEMKNQAVSYAAGLLGLDPYLERKPKDLSGGQRQRVAMGRALVRTPQVFLMDEPLSNLDAKLRVHTRTELAGLQKKLGTTTVYVTHDQVEAMTMGDRVAVLNHGTLEQVASPQELYDHPANIFVAGFIGSPAINFLPATHPRHGDVTLGVRPENTRLVDAQEPLRDFELPVDATCELVERLGSTNYVYAQAHGKTFTARSDREPRIQPGEHVQLACDLRYAHYFGHPNGQRLLV